MGQLLRNAALLGDKAGKWSVKVTISGEDAREFTDLPVVSSNWQSLDWSLPNRLWRHRSESSRVRERLAASLMTASTRREQAAMRSGERLLLRLLTWVKGADPWLA